MLYIISPKPLDVLKKYNIPKTGIFRSPDMAKYMMSNEGKEFFNIEPMRIIEVKDKEQLIFRASTDISFFSMCYNCPLYIYVMEDKTYKNLLNYKIKNHFNMGKGQKLLGDDKKAAEKAKIDPRTTYYNSDEYVITEELRKVVEASTSPNYEIYLTKKDGFVITKTSL